MTGGNCFPGEPNRTWGAWGRRGREALEGPGRLRLVRKKRGCSGIGSYLHLARRGCRKAGEVVFPSGREETGM